MTETPILSFLIEHADKHAVSFHMPGHKGSAIYRKYGYQEFLEKIMDCDITEIIGADNLYQTEGILKAAQEEYAKLYGVKRAYLLINGTSGGLIAAILASVPKGGKIILARNCHKAIYNALILGDIQPVYAYPEMIDEYGISGEITPAEIERCLKENPDASAVILPSPNYYGICSNIPEIAKLVHAAGKILIVDQAHGAHLKFFSDCGYNLPKSAEECGADLTVNSIHKTLASFTQSALLTYNTERVDHYVLEDKLQMIMSTSPSYLLMASLDINADILKHHKKEAIQEWYDALTYFYEEAAKIEGLDIIRTDSLDITKINLDMSAYGITGAELEELLLKEGIYAELTTGNILMCMTGIGNTKADMEKILAALKKKPELLAEIPPEKQNAEMCDLCVAASNELINAAAVQTEEACITVLKKDVLMWKHINNRSRNVSVCALNAACDRFDSETDKNIRSALENIMREILNRTLKPECSEEQMTKRPELIRFYEKGTDKIILSALEKDINYAKYIAVPDTVWKTFIIKHPECIDRLPRFIPSAVAEYSVSHPEYLTEKDFSTSDIKCLLECRPDLIEQFDSETRDYDELCLTAARISPKSIMKMKNVSENLRISLCGLGEDARKYAEKIYVVSPLNAKLEKNIIIQNRCFVNR